MSPAARALTGLLHAYRAWSATRPPRCRFDPSCSHYAEGAIRAHGAMRGVWLATRRVVRCRPGGGVGYDPVPASLRPAHQPAHQEVHRVL